MERMLFLREKQKTMQGAKLAPALLTDLLG
jgi:hypothetical protein